MKKVILLLVSAFIILSCNKGIKITTPAPPPAPTPAPTIVGNWSLVSVSGITIDRYLAGSQFDTTNYYFDSAGYTLTSVDHNIDSQSAPPTNNFDTITYRISTDTWAFRDDGTYTITENYMKYYNNANHLVTDTAIGTWEYQSNSIANNAITFNGPGPQLVGFASPYLIHTVTDKRLVLAVIYNSSSSGNVTYVNYYITFVKQ